MNILGCVFTFSLPGVLIGMLIVAAIHEEAQSRVRARNIKGRIEQQRRNRYE